MGLRVYLAHHYEADCASFQVIAKKAWSAEKGERHADPVRLSDGLWHNHIGKKRGRGNNMVNWLKPLASPDD